MEYLTYDRLKKIFYVSLVLLLIIDFFIPREHVVFWGETIPGFYIIYGFIGCVAIVLFSKFLGIFLKKEEDYYG